MKHTLFSSALPALWILALLGQLPVVAAEVAGPIAAPADMLGKELYKGNVSSGSGYRMVGGAEMLVLRSNLGNGEAFMVGSAAGNVRVRSFEFDYDLAPRIWFGAENCEGTGVRARYFYFSQNADRETAIINLGLNDFAGREISENTPAFRASVDIAGILDEVILADTGLELQAIDFEATQRIDLCPATLNFAAGIRWARTESDLYVRTLDAFDVLDEEYAVASNFEGIGPTFAIDFSRPLWRNLSFVAGTRHSVLVGESDVNVFNLAVQNFEMNDRNAGMYTGEVSVGLQYNRCLRHGRELLIRGGWEAQYWAGMPLATRMGGNFSDSDEMFLDGFSLALGLTY